MFTSRLQSRPTIDRSRLCLRAANGSFDIQVNWAIEKKNKLFLMFCVCCISGEKKGSILERRLIGPLNQIKCVFLL